MWRHLLNQLADGTSLVFATDPYGRNRSHCLFLTRDPDLESRDLDFQSRDPVVLMGHRSYLSTVSLVFYIPN